jgi:hypothetical protein
LLGTLDDFDGLVKEAASHRIRVIVDIVPNHCSVEHPLFQTALAAGPGSPARDRSRVPDGQWYLHLFDSSQPDWTWHHEDVPAFFADVLRFWLDRGVAGLRIDVANSLFKDPELRDIPAGAPLHAPSPHHHRAELHELYPSWRAILESYPADEFPGARTAIGEVWYDVPETLTPYLSSGGLPQVWVIGNHDVPRPVTRFGARQPLIQRPTAGTRLPGRTWASWSSGVLSRASSQSAGSPGCRASSNLDAMPKVKVPRKNVTPGELVTVLGRRLGTGYTVERNGNGRVIVRRSPIAYANISIADSPGASVLRVRAGGPPVLGTFTSWSTTRQVADAIRRSPEFRSL